MKLKFLILLSILIYLLFPVTIKAQGYPNNYELTCPSGSVPMAGPSGTSFNASTGKYRANYCIDPNGNISQNITGVSNFKNLQNVRYVSPTNIEGLPGPDITHWANAAAADLGGPGTVYFRSGSYTVPSNAAGSIQLLSNVQFACTGFRTCTLNGPSFVAGDFFFFAAVAVHDCYVGGFVMVGGSTTLDNRGITNNNAVNFTRCLFENNDISNIFDGIDATNTSNDNTIRNNYIHSVGQQGMTVNGNRNELLENRIDTVGTTNLHHGMYVQDGDSNTIMGNIISNVFGFCIHNFSTSTTSSITSTRVIGNSCISGGLGSGTRGGIAFAETPPSTGNRQGIISNNTIVSTNGNPIYISAVTDAEVSNNTIRTYQGDCIIVQGSNGFTTTNVKINGNICKTQSVTGNGIRVLPNSGGISNIDIENNQVDTVFGIAIWLQSCTDCKVVNNRVKDWNIQGSGSNSGINIDAGTLRAIVSLNNLSNVNTTGNPPGININAGGNGNSVKNNIVENIGTGNLSDAGTNNVKDGNIFSSGPSAGKAVLVAGTVTVSTAEILTGDRVTLSNCLVGGTIGTLSLGTITNTTSFVINSSNAADTSTVCWEIRH